MRKFKLKKIILNTFLVKAQYQLKFDPGVILYG
jgi:hypothetical protein